MDVIQLFDPPSETQSHIIVKGLEIIHHINILYITDARSQFLINISSYLLKEFKSYWILSSFFIFKELGQQADIENEQGDNICSQNYVISWNDMTFPRRMKKTKLISGQIESIFCTTHMRKRCSLVKYIGSWIILILAIWYNILNHMFYISM